MGIDIYLEWDGMTAADHAAQITGMADDKGEVGYLREAYHGEPYGTRILMPEAFAINGMTRDERRDAAFEIWVCDEYAPGGRYHEASTPEREQNIPFAARIPVAVLRDRLDLAQQAVACRHALLYVGLDLPDRPGEATEEQQEMFLSAATAIQETPAPAVKAFEDFVLLAEEKEAAGLHPRVYASF